MRYAFFFATIMLAGLAFTSYGEDAKPIQTVPPASFIYAGPLATPNEDASTSVAFKYTLAIHSITFDHIQIIDTQSQQILVDDTSPKTRESKIKLNASPDIAFVEWDGYTAKEVITEKSPAWLYEPAAIKVVLEARLFKDGAMVSSATQPATYSAVGKMLILQAVKHNKSIPPKESETSNKRL